MYRGCSGPLLATRRHAGDYHGKDGLGDSPDPDAPDLDLLHGRNAVKAMIKMVKENPGEVRHIFWIFFYYENSVTKQLKHDTGCNMSNLAASVQVTLVATGPLTNLAVAVQLAPNFHEKLKALYIMGGNTDCM